jgi:FtsZ-binding cell division protein ZapB
MSKDETKDAEADGGAWNEVKQIADQVRLELHLAGMELKDRWAAIEPKVQALQAKVEAKGHAAAEAVQEQAVSLVDHLRNLLGDLRSEIDGSKKERAADANTSPEGSG